MKKIKVKWLIVGGGVLLSALEALSNLASISHTGALAALWSRGPSPEADQQRTFDVMTYNTSMGPLLGEDRDERTLLISKELGGHDVLLLQGAHSAFHRKLLLTALEDEYPHQSHVLGQAGLLKQDGGVVIVSKWPIEQQRQRPFDDVCNAPTALQMEAFSTRASAERADGSTCSPHVCSRAPRTSRPARTSSESSRT